MNRFVPHAPRPHAARAPARRVRDIALLLIAVGGALAAPSAVRAGLVPAGQTIPFDSATYTDPAGFPVAESDVPFTLQYHPNASFNGFLGTIDGTFSSAVVRDVLDNTLTFSYSISLQSPAGTSGLGESTRLTVAGFGNGSTDLTGWLRSQSTAMLSRSSDGANVEIASVKAGAGGSLLLSVKTTATNYDALGTANFFASDHFAHDTGDVWPASADASFTGVFRPTGETPAAVPLPRGAFSGAGVLIACALIAAGQRRRARRA